MKDNKYGKIAIIVYLCFLIFLNAVTMASKITISNLNAEQLQLAQARLDNATETLNDFEEYKENLVRLLGKLVLREKKLDEREDALDNYEEFMKEKYGDE